jgi:hypothetical protein
MLFKLTWRFSNSWSGEACFIVGSGSKGLCFGAYLLFQPLEQTMQDTRSIANYIEVELCCV